MITYAKETIDNGLPSCILESIIIIESTINPSMRDKIHQNPPYMRDFLYKTNPIQVFCCNFAAVLEKKNKQAL